MNLTCLVKKEGNQYASLCVELDVASCGYTEKEAMECLKDAIETYIEFMKEEGRETEIYRPVSMDLLRDFLFSEPGVKEYKLKAVPLELEHA